MSLPVQRHSKARISVTFIQLGSASQLMGAIPSSSRIRFANPNDVLKRRLKMRPAMRSEVTTGRK